MRAHFHWMDVREHEDGHSYCERCRVDATDWVEFVDEAWYDGLRHVLGEDVVA